MLYKDFFIRFIDRRYLIPHSFESDYIRRSLPPDGEWKYAAIAWRHEDYFLPPGGRAHVIGASTPLIAYDLMRLEIDLRLENERQLMKREEWKRRQAH